MADFEFPKAGAEPTLRVVTVRDFDALAGHAAAWNRLAVNAPQRLPMLSHAWAASFFEYRLRPGESWCCAFAYDGDVLVGVLPLVVTPHRLLGQHRPVLRTPRDVHTRVGDALLVPRHARETLIALLEALRREMPGHLGLELRGVRSNSPTLAAVAAGIPTHLTRCHPAFRGSFLDVGGPIEPYWETLSKSMRRNLRQRRKKLQQRSGRFEIRTLSGVDADPGLLSRFMELEASGWKGRGGTAIGQSPDLAAFYEALVHRLAEAGWLEWHLLEADGRTVAMELAIRFGQALVTPKAAYDEDYAECAPGHLLCEAVFRDAFSQDGLAECNDVSDQDWHRQWRMGSDTYYELHLVPRRAAPIALRFLPVEGGRQLRRRLGPLLPERIRPVLRRIAGR
ncbi:MAG TPA: GNAT family N-acetyltransferase [Arenibaculum sp.]|nr:GNAT family N-acetyltransferase [Arenibaculum sp.]